MSDSPDQILDAVERLCAEMDPSAVTMRLIASEAGVSVGLAYHYFGSKEELFGKLLDRIASDVSEGIDPQDDASAVLTELWSRLEDRPAFVRLIASMILQGGDVSVIMSGRPLIQNVAARAAEAGHHDPAVAAATVAFFGLAGSFFVPSLNHAIGRPADDPALFATLQDLFETQH